MARVLVDSNILIDIATDDPVWGKWSTEALEQVGRGRHLLINPLIYAEVSLAFSRIEDLDQFLPASLFEREDLPWEAGFLAGKAYLAYRRRGGTRASPLPDFYIGAHAALRGHILLTRDKGRYETYFPTVDLIAPLSASGITRRSQRGAGLANGRGAGVVPPAASLCLEARRTNRKLSRQHSPVAETRASQADLRSGASRRCGVRLTVRQNFPRAPLG